MIDETALMVARDAIEERRFDALPEIAQQSASVRAALVADLARAVAAMCEEGVLVEIELRRVPDVAAVRQELINVGASAGGLYPSVTACETKNNRWVSATLHIGRAEINLSSPFQPKTPARRRRTRKASK